MLIPLAGVRWLYYGACRFIFGVCVGAMGAASACAAARDAILNR